MNTTKVFQWGFVSAVLLVVVGYNGCGDSGFNSTYMMGLSSTSAVKGACDAQLMQTYSTTYFPLLSTNCNQCHSASQGSTDLSTSFAVFMQKGTTLMNYQAEHPHGDNGLDLTTQITAITPAWNTAQSAYATCLATDPDQGGGDSGGGNGGVVAVKTIGQVAPNIISTASPTNTKFVTVVWDLSTQVVNSNTAQQAVFSIDVKYSYNSGVLAGLEFHNPRMHLKTAGGTPINVEGLQIYLDGTLQNSVTTWTTSAATVSTTTDTSLSPNGTADAIDAYATVSPTTMIAFEIDIQGSSSTTTTMPSTPTTTVPGATTTTTTLPSVVTFTQLNSSDATLGVFKQSCVGCHSGANAAAALDLTVYSQAKAEAATIKSRMSNTNVPMPPTGLLSQDKINIVNSWVNGGAPQ